MNKFTGRFSFDATTIKLAAVFLMVLDHFYQMFAPLGAPVWLTWLGRPVLVIFLFVLADTFYYTRDRKKLLLRLFLASCLMQIATAVLSTLLPNPQVDLFNNAFATLLTAGLYLMFWELGRAGLRNKQPAQVALAVALAFLPVLTGFLIYYVTYADFWFSAGFAGTWLYPATQLVVGMLPNVLTVEGGPLFILLGLLFYVFRERRFSQAAILAGCSALLFFTYQDLARQWLMVLAALPILLYNGEKGRGFKSFFYLFYPAHIFLLYLVATILLQGR